MEGAGFGFLVRPNPYPYPSLIWNPGGPAVAASIWFWAPLRGDSADADATMQAKRVVWRNFIIDV